MLSQSPPSNECDPCASNSDGNNNLNSGKKDRDGCPSDNPSKDEECPFVKMSLEEFADCFPDDAPNFIERPTFWPHTKEEQLTPADEHRQKHQKPMD